MHPDKQTMESIMSAIITLLYREYCKACLAEMRKVHRGSSD